ncbi:profilin-1-like [Brachyhypopomus gauderio]|uniref:profilin-1-like n=1 Tax=Brachyhypopomus gauderio TaxID=698409 RepID=UPI004042AB01
MSWDSYITNLTGGDWVDEAVIVGHTSGQESVWASSPNGFLKNITAAEVKALCDTDRSKLFAGGVTIGGKKCTVLRDALHVDGQNTMDLKMKTSEHDPHPYSFTVGKTCKALIIAKGVKDAHGGKVNPLVFDMTAYLRKLNL